MCSALEAGMAALPWSGNTFQNHTQSYILSIWPLNIAQQEDRSMSSILKRALAHYINRNHDGS